jgi:hypothetical protein
MTVTLTVTITIGLLVVSAGVFAASFLPGFARWEVQRRQIRLGLTLEPDIAAAVYAYTVDRYRWSLAGMFAGVATGGVLTIPTEWSRVWLVLALALVGAAIGGLLQRRRHNTRVGRRADDASRAPRRARDYFGLAESIVLVALFVLLGVAAALTGDTSALVLYALAVVLVVAAMFFTPRTLDSESFLASGDGPVWDDAFRSDALRDPAFLALGVALCAAQQGLATADSQALPDFARALKDLLPATSGILFVLLATWVTVSGDRRLLRRLWPSVGSRQRRIG